MLALSKKFNPRSSTFPHLSIFLFRSITTSNMKRSEFNNITPTPKTKKLDNSHDFLKVFTNGSNFSAPLAKSRSSFGNSAPKRPNNKTMPKVYDSLTEPFRVAGLKKTVNVNKICTYNVASVRAASVKGVLEYVQAEDPTVLCLQETKLQVPPTAESIYSFQPQYPHQFWWCSTSKKGFHGTAILSKTEPISHIYGFVQNPDIDTEGRVVSVEFAKFYLVNAYVPFVGVNLERLNFRMEWEKNMLEHLNTLESRGKPIIYAGDLNVAPNSIDTAPALQKERSPGTTSEEIACFNKILRGGNDKEFPRIDVDRHFYPQELNRFTAYSYYPGYRSNVWGWRFDYFIASRSLLPSIAGTDIRFEFFGASDHVPSVLWLTTPLE